MKIEIKEPGWAGYTGHFGTTEFKDGVSVHDVSTADAAALAALVRIEEVGTGRNPSDSQRILDRAADLAPIEDTVAKPEKEVATAPTLTHTKESLEAIADKSGIKGVRDVGDDFGVRGTSIADLIEKILAAQAEKVAAEAAAAAAEAPKSE